MLNYPHLEQLSTGHNPVQVAGNFNCRSNSCSVAAGTPAAAYERFSDLSRYIHAVVVVVVAVKMVLSAVYILDAKGKVLISRNYRGDVEPATIEKFIGLVTDREDEGQLTPLIQTEEAAFAYIKHNNLYVVATTKKNSNVAMIFSLLHKICAVRVIFFL